MSVLRTHARTIWQAAVDAADPFQRVQAVLADPASAVRRALGEHGRILVVGGGKAGAAMAAGVEAGLSDLLNRIHGLVNVPEGASRPLSRIRLHPARPAASNQPTAAGVAGTLEQLDLVHNAQPGDVGLCLLSGGGSALLPAPVNSVSLEDKQEVTKLLHACGATIDEMNCVRKHLSRYKGGRLARAFADRQCPLFSLIVSDVIGDPLDVIASGPTAPDPTTFADALAVLDRYQLGARVPASVRAYLERGQVGAEPETLDELPAGVHNLVLCNNAGSLEAAAAVATELGYRVLNLGPFLEGETRPVAIALAGVARGVRAHGMPIAPPACLLSGGETTVTLTPNHGKGGRNQEFVLAALVKLGLKELTDMVILSGGTDGEDGPTDAAGALGDGETLSRAAALGLDPVAFLERHDAYPFFTATQDLVKTGLTGTNVMDVRVILVR